jgi:hypothetical protein
MSHIRRTFKNIKYIQIYFCASVGLIVHTVSELKGFDDNLYGCIKRYANGTVLGPKRKLSSTSGTKSKWLDMSTLYSGCQNPVNVINYSSEVSQGKASKD